MEDFFAIKEQNFNVVTYLNTDKQELATYHQLLKMISQTLPAPSITYYTFSS